MGQRVTFSGKVNRERGAEGKPSLNRANIVAGSRPETGRSSHGQGEGGVIPTGGPNPLMLKNQGMSCG